VEIFETTLRDGEQEAFVYFSPQQKVELAMLFEEIGVDVIDAGFPAASQVDLESVRLIASNTTNVKLSVLSRPIKQDICMAHEAVKGAEKRTRIATSTKPYDLLTGENHVDANGYKKTIEKSCAIVNEVRTLFPEAQYYLVCAGSRDWNFLAELSEAVVDAGATHIVVADSLSTMEPHSYGNLVSHIKKYLPPTTVLSVHCHNLLGLGLPNSIAGIKNGAEQVEVTVGNLGDAGGNTALEQVLAYAAFFEKDNPKFSCNCCLDGVYQVAQKVSEFSSIQFSSNQPLIGEHSFTVETGIHQSFPPEIVENTFTPGMVGRDTKTIVGRHSGISGIKKKLNENNVAIDGINPNLLYKEVMKIAEKDGVVSDKKLKKLANSLVERQIV
jgi:2-isopropylmalate synthase